MFAVITGASSGIGKEIAREFAIRGYSVILVARRKNKLIELQEELTKNYRVLVDIFACDLSNQNDCYRLHEFCKSKRIGIFVNNAGIGKAGYVTEMNTEVDIAMINTNLIAVHLLTKLFAQSMKKGVICNVCSTAAFQPGPGMAAYGASKAYVYQFSRAMNYELIKQKNPVRIVTVCPGPVDTVFGGTSSDSVLRRKFMLSAKDCAKITVEGILNKKEVIIPGTSNYLLRWITRFAPEKLVLCLEHKIQSSKFK